MGRTLSCYMLCWGVVVLCVGFAQNFTQLITLRALQGLFEVSPLPPSSPFKFNPLPPNQDLWMNVKADTSLVV